MYSMMDSRFQLTSKKIFVCVYLNPDAKESPACCEPCHVFHCKEMTTFFNCIKLYPCRFGKLVALMCSNAYKVACCNFIVHFGTYLNSLELFKLMFLFYRKANCFSNADVS